jgi:hypothetical protein
MSGGWGRSIKMSEKEFIIFFANLIFNAAYSNTVGTQLNGVWGCCDRFETEQKKSRLATLRQRDALEGADDVVGSFFGEEAFVITGAEVPVRAFVIIVAIKAPYPAHHNDAAHPVVPVIADIVETQVRSGVGAFEADMVVKDQFRQPNNFLARFHCDLAGSRSVIAEGAEFPFHVDDAPVIGRQFNFR